MFKNKRLDRLEDRLDSLEAMIEALSTSTEVTKFETVNIKYKDKKKGLIFCGRCKGVGFESNDWYGGKRECRFCDGKGYVKLKAV